MYAQRNPLGDVIIEWFKSSKPQRNMYMLGIANNEILHFTIQRYILVYEDFTQILLALQLHISLHLNHMTKVASLCQVRVALPQFSFLLSCTKKL